MSLNSFERETTVTTSDGDDLVRVWTAQRTVITRISRDSRFTIVDSGEHDGSRWVSATIPAEKWNPVTGAKRTRTMTDEQKAAAAERLRAAREVSR